MGRLQVKTKNRDESHHSSLKVSTKAIQLEGERAEQWKIYTHSILSERFWLILSDCQGWEYQGMDKNI